MKKCTPITLLELSHAEAIEAIDSDDVLVAIIQSVDTIASILENISFLISKSSIIASTTKSLLLMSLNLLEKLIRLRISIF